MSKQMDLVANKILTDYELVWSDEFDYEGMPDETKWSYDIGGHGWGNQELQYYTADKNAFVSEGRLVIEARKEMCEQMAYTSARLVTKNKGDFLYGKFEISAKVPKGLGTWPAIWMLPTNWEYGTWPQCGEIDIMEHVGYHVGDILGTVHTGTYNHTIGTQKGNHIKVDHVDDEYHVYSIEWLPNKIDFYVDQQLYFTFDPKQLSNKITPSEWPYDRPFHLILNVAVGGTLGGKQGVHEEEFPQRLEVEYVRVYQSKTLNRLLGEEI